MSLEQEAKAEAEAEYPLLTDASISVEASVARMRRVPFAHGYVRGYRERGLAEAAKVVDILENLNALNEAGRIRHDDYSELHDMVSGLLP